MKVLGVGLSRTGTLSLHCALQMLGYRSVHWAPERLREEMWGEASNYQKFDDVDAVSDIPAAFFYREIGQAYPDIKYVLTIRDEDRWYVSLKQHISQVHALLRGRDLSDANRLHQLVYGSEQPVEELYKESFRTHNCRVVQDISQKDLLIMNICDGDGWEVLCPFLGEKAPSTPFPWENQT